MEFGGLAAFNSRSALPLSGDPQFPGSTAPQNSNLRNRRPRMHSEFGDFGRVGRAVDSHRKSALREQPGLVHRFRIQKWNFWPILGGCNHSNQDLIGIPLKTGMEDCEPCFAFGEFLKLTARLQEMDTNSFRRSFATNTATAASRSFTRSNR
jgi:hypothetical protein